MLPNTQIDNIIRDIWDFARSTFPMGNVFIKHLGRAIRIKKDTWNADIAIEGRQQKQFCMIVDTHMPLALRPKQKA